MPDQKLFKIGGREEDIYVFSRSFRARDLQANRLPTQKRFESLKPIDETFLLLHSLLKKYISSSPAYFCLIVLSFRHLFGGRTRRYFQRRLEREGGSIYRPEAQNPTEKVMPCSPSSKSHK